MCIVFLYSGLGEDSDFSFILAANRDEFYDRPSKDANFWSEDPTVIGGRGKIVKDFVLNDATAEEYIDAIRSYGKETNDFNFVMAEFGLLNNKIQTYSNATDQLESYSDNCLGFSNSLPDTPFNKVIVGKKRFNDICRRINKEADKELLVEELTQLLKWDERHLPDKEILKRNPNMYEYLSSVCVCIPKARYGTRTHTIIVVTKSGHVDFVEFTMKAPIDPSNPQWQRSAFQFDIRDNL